MTRTVADQLNLALSFHHRGLLDEAERHYRAVLSEAPEQPDALQLLGILEAQRGQHGRAADFLRRSVLAAPSDVFAHFNLGNVLHELGHLDEAFASYASALRLSPDHIESLNNQGSILEQRKRPSEALAKYEQALAIEPGNPSLIYNRANVLRTLERLGEALAAYSSILAVDPRHFDALNNRGNLFLKLRRYDEALADHSAALALQPGNAVSLCNCANVHAERGAFQEALAAYNKVIAANPNFAQAYQGRARVQYELGRFDDSFLDYDKAFALEPDLPYVEGFRLHVKMQICDWRNIADELSRLSAHVCEAKWASEPFSLLLTYASHTTASDALWAGVPVLTCLGSTFSGRVAVSVLKAVGLRELVAGNIEEYEALALKIALAPALLSRLKAELARNRLNLPLFDTARYARNLEAAFMAMHDRHRRGLPPEGFAVTASG